MQLFSADGGGAQESGQREEVHCVPTLGSFFNLFPSILVMRYLGVLFVLFLVGCAQQRGELQDTGTQTSDEVKTLEDGTKYIIHPSKIRGGGPPKDGIPSIDNPKYVKAKDVDWLTEEELVLGIEYRGVSRAYPFQILVWHEIVNDRIAGEPVLITYCPLCLTGLAFERKINNEEVEFGTSGKLYNSNLVMYDRKTDTYWSQASGKAIVGPLTGMRLKQMPIDTARWRDWLAAHPDTEVLSRDTGFSRNYGTDPYGGYYDSDAVWFPLENRDLRLHPKEQVAGIEIGNITKAYPVSEVAKDKVVNDKIAGKALLIIEHPVTKAVRIFERELNGKEVRFEMNNGRFYDVSGNEWKIEEGKIISGQSELKETPAFSGFWFSWASFHPNSEIFKA